AEDGIRDYKVTGVQTCALPILDIEVVRPRGAVGKGLAIGGPAVEIARRVRRDPARPTARGRDQIDRPGRDGQQLPVGRDAMIIEIGRASCRERVENWVYAVARK